MQKSLKITDVVSLLIPLLIFSIFLIIIFVLKFKKIDIMNHAKIIKNNRGRQSTYTFINFFNLSNDFLCVEILKNRYNESCKNH